MNVPVLIYSVALTPPITNFQISALKLCSSRNSLESGVLWGCMCPCWGKGNPFHGQASGRQEWTPPATRSPETTPEGWEHHTGLTIVQAPTFAGLAFLAQHYIKRNSLTWTASPAQRFFLVSCKYCTQRCSIWLLTKAGTKSTVFAENACS